MTRRHRRPLSSRLTEIVSYILYVIDHGASSNVAATPMLGGTRLMSHRSHRTVLTTLLGAMMALALVVLSPFGRSPVAARSTLHPAAASLPVLTLSYYAGQSQLARTLDPSHIGVTTDEDMLLLIDAGLIHVGTDDKVEPDLASHWTVSNDHRTYTFYIR